jgi:hypothetical protein
VNQRQFGKALTRMSELLSPLYKPLFVIYVMSTIAALIIGSFTEFDAKQVGRSVIYAMLLGGILVAITITIQAIYSERVRRNATPNPHLRIVRQTLKIKFLVNGNVEICEKLLVISTKNGISGSNEWNGWHGKGHYEFTNAIGGSVKNVADVDHTGMNFFFTFDSPLQKGQDHEYRYIIRFDNSDEFIKKFIQRESYYAPEESLVLEIEEETSNPLIVKRMTKYDVYRSPKTILEPELVCYRRHSWHIADPQHGSIYEIHWEHA